MWRGYEVTVAELISFVAHIGGAVHLGKPRTEKERALHEMAELARVGQASPVVAQLQAIGRVVLRSLVPLRDAVARELTDHGIAVTTPPTHIVGASATDLLTTLERFGFAHPIAKTAAAGGAALQASERWRFDDLALYSVVVAHEADRVRLLTATVHALREDVEAAALEARAIAGLISIATLAGLCPAPERAGAWVRANIAQPSARLTLGDTFFEIDAARTVPGRQYRLTILAVGARPRALA